MQTLIEHSVNVNDRAQCTIESLDSNAFETRILQELKSCRATGLQELSGKMSGKHYNSRTLRFCCRLRRGSSSEFQQNTRTRILRTLILRRDIFNFQIFNGIKV